MNLFICLLLNYRPPRWGFILLLLIFYKQVVPSGLYCFGYFTNYFLQTGRPFGTLLLRLFYKLFSTNRSSLLDFIASVILQIIFYKQVVPSGLYCFGYFTNYFLQTELPFGTFLFLIFRNCFRQTINLIRAFIFVISQIIYYNICFSFLIFCSVGASCL